jgi:hypothetical protein
VAEAATPFVPSTLDAETAGRAFAAAFLRHRATDGACSTDEDGNRSAAPPSPLYHPIGECLYRRLFLQCIMPNSRQIRRLFVCARLLSNSAQKFLRLNFLDRWVS